MNENESEKRRFLFGVRGFQLNENIQYFTREYPYSRLRKILLEVTNSLFLENLELSLDFETKNMETVG